MFKATIRSGEVPGVHVSLTPRQIELLFEPVITLEARDVVRVQNEGVPAERAVRARVMDVDWDLADKLIVLASDGSVYLAHVQDWDEDHATLVIELD